MLPTRSARKPPAHPVSLIVSDASIKAAMERVKLFECVGKGGGALSSRLDIQATLSGLAVHQLLCLPTSSITFRHSAIGADCRS